MSGTILQNISFFDDLPDHTFAAECARLAWIHEEIMRLPMGYRTLIGGLGSTLSAGQRQRVLLARALIAGRTSCSWTKGPPISTSSSRSGSTRRC